MQCHSLLNRTKSFSTQAEVNAEKIESKKKMNFKAYEQNSERKDERMFEVFYFILKRNPKKLSYRKMCMKYFLSL